MKLQTTPHEVMSDAKKAPLCIVDPEDNLTAVIAAMVESAQPIAVVATGGSSLAGVVSEGDIIRAIADGADLDTIWAGDIMTTDLVEVEEHTAAWDVLELMLGAQLRHVIVQGDEPAVVGFFEVVDLVIPRD